MLNAYLDIQPEVAAALCQQTGGGPGVHHHLHGMPYPQNVETARQVEQVVRDNGAVPATIAIIDRLQVGLDGGAGALGQTRARRHGSAAAATSPSCWPARGWGDHGSLHHDHGCHGGIGFSPPAASAACIAAPGDLRHLRRPAGICPNPGGRGLRRRQVDPRHRSDPGYLETQGCR